MTPSAWLMNLFFIAAYLCFQDVNGKLTLTVETVFALQESRLEIPCYPSDHKSRGKGLWTHDNQTLASQSGNLIIKNLEVKDSGRYRCEINKKAINTHDLRVFQLRIKTYSAQQKFTATGCSETTKEARIKYVKMAFCDLSVDCIYDFEASCEPQSVSTSPDETMIIPVNITADTQSMHIDRRHQTSCNADCQLKYEVTVLLNGFITGRRALLKMKIDSMKKDTPFIPMLIKVRCTDGFEIFGDSMCLPCKPGYYQNKIGECHVCLRNSYQSKYAQLTCIDCPDGFVTTTVASDEAEECIDFSKTRLVEAQDVHKRQDSGIADKAALAHVVPTSKLSPDTELSDAQIVDSVLQRHNEHRSNPQLQDNAPDNVADAEKEFMVKKSFEEATSKDAPSKSKLSKQEMKNLNRMTKNQRKHEDLTKQLDELAKNDYRLNMHNVHAMQVDDEDDDWSEEDDQKHGLFGVFKIIGAIVGLMLVVTVIVILVAFCNCGKANVNLRRKLDIRKKNDQGVEEDDITADIVGQAFAAPPKKIPFKDGKQENDRYHPRNNGEYGTVQPESFELRIPLPPGMPNIGPYVMGPASFGGAVPPPYRQNNGQGNQRPESFGQSAPRIVPASGNPCGVYISRTNTPPPSRQAHSRCMAQTSSPSRQYNGELEKCVRSMPTPYRFEYYGNNAYGIDRRGQVPDSSVHSHMHYESGPCGHMACCHHISPPQAAHVKLAGNASCGQKRGKIVESLNLNYRTSGESDEVSGNSKRSVTPEPDNVTAIQPRDILYHRGHNPEAFSHGQRPGFVEPSHQQHHHVTFHRHMVDGDECHPSSHIHHWLNNCNNADQSPERNRERRSQHHPGRITNNSNNWQQDPEPEPEHAEEEEPQQGTSGGNDSWETTNMVHTAMYNSEELANVSWDTTDDEAAAAAAADVESDESEEEAMGEEAQDSASRCMSPLSRRISVASNRQRVLTRKITL